MLFSDSVHRRPGGLIIHVIKTGRNQLWIWVLVAAVRTRE